MQTIGERLEEARKRKGVSIREAAEATKIRSDYLQKFEANSFDLDLPPLYIRGFMRSYARFLDLDQERFIAEYDSVAAAEGRAPRRTDSRENYGRVEFAENGEATAGKRSSVDQAMLMKYGLFGGGAIAVIVLLIVIINFFTSSPAPKPTQSAPTTATPVAQPPVATEATLTITVAEPTRVKVSYHDGSAVFLDGKFPLSRGEVKTITFTKDLIITLEHPNRIRLERNGRALDLAEIKPMSRFKVPLADSN